MDTKYATIRDENLLKQASKIFGDIVVDAFVACQVYDFYAGVDIDKDLRMMMQNESCVDSEMINIATGYTVIAFSNGKNILFDVSEWCLLSEFTGKLQGE